jgi:glucan-binding YG repeat protein
MPSCDQVPGGPSTPIKSTPEEADTPKKASPFNKAKATAKSPNKRKNPSPSKKTEPAKTKKNQESTKAKKKQEPSQSKVKSALWANTTVPEVKPDDYNVIVEHQKWFFYHLMTQKECDTLATFWVTNNAKLRPIDQCMMSSNVQDMDVIDWILRCQPDTPMTQEVNDAS